MLQAELGKEIVIETVHDAGMMAAITKALADRGVGILAINSHFEGVNSIIHLVTDDNVHARDALEKNHLEPFENRVVIAQFSRGPGVWKNFAEVLDKAGI